MVAPVAMPSSTTIAVRPSHGRAGRARPGTVCDGARSPPAGAALSSRCSSPGCRYSLISRVEDRLRRPPSTTAPIASSGWNGAPILRTSTRSSGRLQDARDLKGDGHAAARQREHDGLLILEVVQPLRQRASRLRVRSGKTLVLEHVDISLSPSRRCLTQPLPGPDRSPDRARPALRTDAPRRARSPAAFLALQPVEGRAVEIQHADDPRRPRSGASAPVPGRAPRQPCPGGRRARPRRRYRRGSPGRRDQRRRGAGAGAEITDPQAPVSSCSRTQAVAASRPLGQQIDVEDVAAIGRLLRQQQIEQQRARPAARSAAATWLLRGLKRPLPLPWANRTMPPALAGRGRPRMPSRPTGEMRTSIVSRRRAGSAMGSLPCGLRLCDREPRPPPSPDLRATPRRSSGCRTAGPPRPRGDAPGPP